MYVFYQNVCSVVGCGVLRMSVRTSQFGVLLNSSCPFLSSVYHISSIKMGYRCLYYLPNAYFSFPFLSAFPKSKGPPSDACILIVAIASFAVAGQRLSFPLVAWSTMTSQELV